jgi:hypothetical protein
MLTTDAMAAALAAGGPHPDHADALMLFGRFAGSWDIRSVRFTPEGGAEPEQRLEWHFGWALDGRAVVDVLRGEGGIGTTVRIYHPHTGTWSVSWQSTRDPYVFTLVARPDGDRIVLEGSGPDGLEEWSFSEITDTSFVWRSRVSGDGGATWFVDQEMRATRRA